METFHENDSGVDVSFSLETLKINHRPYRRNSNELRKTSGEILDRQLEIRQNEHFELSNPQILQCDMQSPQGFKRPMSGHSGTWQVLTDDDPWIPQDSPNWTPMQTWNSHSNSYAQSSRNRNLPPLFPATRKYSRNCCLRFAALLLFISLVITTITVWAVGSNRYDPSTGAKGAVPQVAPGPPLPVRGVLNSTQSLNSSFYFGAAIDWHFNSDLNVTVAIHDAQFFLDKQLVLRGMVNSSGILHQVDDIFDWTAALVRGTGAIMGVTIIPTIALDLVPQSAYLEIARKCKAINDMGVSVLLRFAPEMNGNWYPYGQKPQAFISAFRNVSVLVHNTTLQTALVWSPSSAFGYPFINGRFYPNGTIPVELDTNGNGKLDERDDPFSPYYPGDQYVDWVGFSAFYSGSPGDSTLFPIPADYPALLSASTPAPSNTNANTNLNNITIIPRNALPSNTSTSFFEEQLTNPGFTYSFYRDYCEFRKKPFILASTGAAYYTSDASVSEIGLKNEWFRQVFATISRYPLVKALVVYDRAVDQESTSFGSLFRSTSPRLSGLVDFTISKPQTRSYLAALVTGNKTTEMNMSVKVALPASM